MAGAVMIGEQKLTERTSAFRPRAAREIQPLEILLTRSGINSGAV